VTPALVQVSAWDSLQIWAAGDWDIEDIAECWGEQRQERHMVLAEPVQPQVALANAANILQVALLPAVGPHPAEKREANTDTVYE